MPSKSNLLILANRLPVHRVSRSTWQTSPGGLVTALTPVMRERASVWIGWPGITSPVKPFEHEGIKMVPLALRKQDIEGFYDGFSNGTLWPLYHDAVRTPEYHRHWWLPYQSVNRRFAEAAAETAAKNAHVWVNDYHLQLVPGYLRELRPDLRIGFFMHIPFPPEELYMQLPWRKEIVEGLLGADVVGFQTPVGASNFMELVKRLTDAKRSGHRISFNGHTTRVGAFPVSVDFDVFESLARDADVRARADEYRYRLGPKRKIVLGIDRLDYTKGIDRRLRAISEILRSGALTVDDFVFVQTAVPSRERVEEYKQLEVHVSHLVGQINGEYGEVGRTPIQYFHRNFDRSELVALYSAAQVMLVTPLRDGMNLVAKEYAATRVNNDGVLVLSEFTGSAHELKSAVHVNPHDIDGMAAAIVDAVEMPSREQSKRMRSLRKVIKENDVFAWSNSFLEAMEA